MVYEFAPDNRQNTQRERIVYTLSPSIFYGRVIGMLFLGILISTSEVSSNLNEPMRLKNEK